MDNEENVEQVLDEKDEKNDTNDNNDKQVVDVEHQADCDVERPTLTKSQMKKLKKKERWEQVKGQKRKAEKDRYKARKKACLERGEDVGPSRKQLKRNKMSKSSCKVQVVVDCDFDQYMAEKDIKMLVKQIQFSYSSNRRAENPMQFHCCGISGKTKGRLESLRDYKGWDIHFHDEAYLELFDKKSVVYLSSESPNILNTLEDDKVYIIGGLVDHNHQKGLCHRLAEEKGIAHAQLPISDYINMKTRKVLTINHVFDILLNYTETKDWQKSFYKVLPPRKGAVPKTDASSQKTDVNCDKGDNSDIACLDKGSNTDEGKRDSSHSDPAINDDTLDLCEEKCSVSAEDVAENVTTAKVNEVSDNNENVKEVTEKN